MIIRTTHSVSSSVIIYYAEVQHNSHRKVKATRRSVRRYVAIATEPIARIAKPPNSVQLKGTPTIPPS